MQYLPKQVWQAYKKMSNALQKDTGKTLLVSSGYRSPAYQIIIFLHYLKHYKNNLKKTLRRVALPGWSEHGNPNQQAIDFMTKDGKPSEKNPLDFIKTREYSWLVKNANNYNFYLSYPRNNKLGIMFEPWHWHFKTTLKKPRKN